MMLASSFEHRFENLHRNPVDRDVIVQTANRQLKVHSTSNSVIAVATENDNNL